MRTLAIALGAMAVIYGLWSYAYPTNSFRYRLTLEVSVDGKPVIGTGVIEVTQRMQPKIGDAPSSVRSIKGEAIFVDLGARGFLFALLKGRNPGFGAGAIVYSAIPPLTPHGRGAALPENLRRYQTQTLRAELSAEQLPLLVRFRDINDPMTVERVDPGNLAASFGGGVSLTRASLETTRDPVTTGIDRRLPWLKPLKGGYLDGKFASGNSPLGLDGGDFRRGF